MTRYDAATRLWTTVFAVALVALVDWCAVAIPVRHHVARAPHWGWWTAGMVAVVLPPLAWLVDAAWARRGNAIVLWTVVLASVVVGQLIVRTLGS